MFIAMQNRPSPHYIRKECFCCTVREGTGGTGPTPDGERFSEVDLCGPRAMEFDEGGGNLWLALREGNQV
jgi:hypothetical protein